MAILRVQLVWHGHRILEHYCKTMSSCKIKFREFIILDIRLIVRGWHAYWRIYYSPAAQWGPVTANGVESLTESVTDAWKES